MRVRAATGGRSSSAGLGLPRAARGEIMSEGFQTAFLFLLFGIWGCLNPFA